MLSDAEIVFARATSGVLRQQEIEMAEADIIDGKAFAAELRGRSWAR